jgi:DNA-binding XRE family transcriptional regulator
MNFVVSVLPLVYSSSEGGYAMSFEFLFSSHVFHARTSLGLKQPYVADILGISLREYQNIEYGRVAPQLKTFLKLVYLFDLDIDAYREVLGIEKIAVPSR